MENKMTYHYCDGDVTTRDLGFLISGTGNIAEGFKECNTGVSYKMP